MEWTNTMRVLEEFGAYFRNLLQDRIIEEDMIASGELLNDLDYIIDTGENEWTVSVKIKDYFKFLDEGWEPAGKFKNPGWKAYPFIRRWIEVKPIYPEVDSAGKTPSVDSLAFLITRSMKENGLEPREVWEPTVQEAVDKFEERIGDAILEDLGTDVERTLMEIY